MKRAWILLLLATGCDQVEKLEAGGEINSASLVPQAVQLRLTESCAIPGCHTTGSVAPDLSAAGGGAWVGQSGAGGPFVTFGDLDNSYLVEKMFPSPGAGSQMPLAPGTLSPEDLALIVGWIAGVDFPEGETDGQTDGGSDTG